MRAVVHGVGHAEHRGPGGMVRGNLQPLRSADDEVARLLGGVAPPAAAGDRQQRADRSRRLVGVDHVARDLRVRRDALRARPAVLVGGLEQERQPRALGVAERERPRLLEQGQREIGAPELECRLGRLQQQTAAARVIGRELRGALQRRRRLRRGTALQRSSGGGLERRSDLGVGSDACRRAVPHAAVGVGGVRVGERGVGGVLGGRRRDVVDGCSDERVAEAHDTVAHRDEPGCLRGVEPVHVHGRALDPGRGFQDLAEAARLAERRDEQDRARRGGQFVHPVEEGSL